MQLQLLSVISSKVVTIYSGWNFLKCEHDFLHLVTSFQGLVMFGPWNQMLKQLGFESCLACVGCTDHVTLLFLCWFLGLCHSSLGTVVKTQAWSHTTTNIATQVWAQLQDAPYNLPRDTKFKWIFSREASLCVPRNHWCPQCHRWSAGHQYDNKWSRGSAWTKAHN